jgi:uncharacterized protein YggE
MRLILSLAVPVLLSVPVVAQQTAVRRGVIRAFGEGSVAVRPDMAKVSVGVTTQAGTASEAASRNADQVAAVIAALRSVLGQTAEIRTITYSLGPNYQYPPGGGQPTLNGFTANNVVEATMADLGIIGRVIDTAIAAGANRVESLRLGLKDEEPVRIQALRLAGQKARLKAESIAQGVGVRVGPVVSVAEGYSVTPVPIDRAGGATTAATPVVPGTLDVHATVTLDVEALP